MTLPTPSHSAVHRTGGALLVAVLGVLLLVGPAAGTAGAHPLGNFTTNTSAAVIVQPEAVEVVYVLDLAEVPTQQTRGAIEDAGGEEAWAQEECVRIADAQDLTVAGSPTPLVPTGVSIGFPAGQAGLDTLRLTCGLRAPLEAGADGSGTVALTYEDGYTGDRIGWREVVAVGDGTTLTTSDVPAVSETDQLRDYPEAEVSTVVSARLTVDRTGGTGAPDALRSTDLAPVEVTSGGVFSDGLEGVVDAYTDLIARQTLTPPFVLLAIVLAILLGTAHAVAPGHGKTVIAAYLLGEGGQARQAVTLGSTVAITHTIGVLVLGVIVQTSTTLAPESLYPVLGVMGGVIFTGLGLLLLYRAITNRGHSHDHGHGHDHGHAHDHGHGHDHEALVPAVVAAEAAVVDGGSAHPATAPAHDHGGHDQGDHDHAAHDHADHDHAAHDHADHDHGAHDHADHGGHHGHDHGMHDRSAAGQSTWRMLILPGLAGGMVPSPSALLVLLGGIALDRTWFGVLLVLAYGVGMALALVGAGYLLHRVRFRVMDRLESATWARVSTALPIVTSSLIILGGFVIIGRSLLTA